MSARGPHAGGRVVAAGAPLARASGAVIALHGRGGAPEDVLGLADHLALPDLAWLAPEAAGRSGWPVSFLAPIEALEPGLSSALSVVAALRERLEAEGVVPARTVVLGFSQGGCLALEHAARAGAGLRAAAGLSAGLVGTADADDPPSEALYGHAPKAFDYPSRLDGVPVLVGCHERDPHIPLARVRESADALGRLGAEVTTLIHPGAGHAVVEPEIRALRGMLNA